MSDSRPQAEQENKGYPMMDVIKQNEGLEKPTGLKDFFESLEPLDDLKHLPIKSKDRIFTIANVTEDNNRINRVLKHIQTLRAYYSKPGTIQHLLSNPKILNELVNSPLGGVQRLTLSQEVGSEAIGIGLGPFLSQLEQTLIGVDIVDSPKEKSVEKSEAVTTEKDTESVLSSVVTFVKKLFESKDIKPGAKSESEITQALVDATKDMESPKEDNPKIQEIAADIAKSIEIPNVEKDIAQINNIEDLSKALVNFTNKGIIHLSSLNRKAEISASIAEALHLSEIFINVDNPSIHSYLTVNTIKTSGDMGVLDYSSKSIVTAHSAIFLKVGNDSVKGSKGEIDIVVVYGTDQNKYAILPQQLETEELGTYTIDAGTYLYKNYPKMIFSNIDKGTRTNNKIHSPADIDWNVQTKVGNRYLLRNVITVKKRPGGTSDYSPADGNPNVSWVSVQIISEKPYDLEGDIFAVEERYLNKQLGSSASLKKASDDLFPTDPPGTWRLHDKPSEMTIDQSSAGNEEPIQKSKGLTPFKMPGYEDPSIKMSESPEIEYFGKDAEYSKLAKLIGKNSSKVSEYLNSKIGK